MDKGKVMRFARNALLIFVLLLVMVWVKTYFSGRAQYLAGEQAYSAGNMKDAITDYETAIHMYAPFAGYVPSSAQRLWDIGQGFEKAGDYDWALIAYRSLRSSFYAVRSFYTPYREWIDRSERQIDEVLEAQKQQQAKAPAGREEPAKAP
jgi:hypothetical protein